MPTAEALVTVFLALHLIAGDKPATEAEGAFLSYDGRGEVAWAVGVRLGLVGKAERPWHAIPPFHPIRDHRHDLDTLRGRAHPQPVPMRMPG